MTTRVFLVDDHEIVRRGLADLLDLDRDIEVVGQAGTATTALRQLRTTDVDVALVDVRLPDGSGIDVCREVRARGTKPSILMLSSFVDSGLLAAAARSGASGYLLKELRGPQIVMAIHRAAKGGRVFTDEQLEEIRGHRTPSLDALNRYEQLTPKERQVLEFVGEGLTNKEIGEQMSLAEKTVKNYLSSIMAKLGVQRRTQAAVMVTRGDFRTDHAVDGKGKPPTFRPER